MGSAGATELARRASWLGHEERVALERELAAESAARERRGRFTLRGALTDRRILHCAAVYFTINFASYGAIFWFADILERIGASRESSWVRWRPSRWRLGPPDWS
jgi:MFS transporter, ACS family, tartrate transporter